MNACMLRGGKGDTAKDAAREETREKPKDHIGISNDNNSNKKTQTG